MISYGLIAILSTVLLWSFAQILGKVTSPRIGNVRLTFIVLLAGALPMVILYIMNPTTIGMIPILLSVLSGIATTFGFIFYYKSVQTEQVSSVVPTTLIQPALLAIYGFVILLQPVNTVQIIGTLVVFAGVSIVLISRNLKINKALIPAVFGNISWAIYWIFLSTAMNSTNQVVTPLLISRTASVITIIIFILFFSRESIKDKIKFNNMSLALILALAVIEGIFDGSGNLIFGVAVNLNLLGIGAVLTTLEPILIIGIAYFIFRERLTRAQLFGMLIATAGAAIIAVF